MSNKYAAASKAHFTAVKLEAEAVLDTYFNNSVGIGEHSDIPAEVNKWVDKKTKQHLSTSFYITLVSVSVVF